MPCFRPLSAYRTDDGQIVFNVTRSDSLRFTALVLLAVSALAVISKGPESGRSLYA